MAANLKILQPDIDTSAGSSHRGKFVAYFRVSTDKQGKSGLGLEAQRKSVGDYLDGARWSLVAEFTEVESGKHITDRNWKRRSRPARSKKPSWSLPSSIGCPAISPLSRLEGAAGCTVARRDLADRRDHATRQL